MQPDELARVRAVGIVANRVRADHDQRPVRPPNAPSATAPAGRELLARGRLSEELSGTGWEIVAGFAPSPRARPNRAAKQVDAPADTTAKHAAEVQAQSPRLRELEKSLTAAEKRQRTASRQERAAAERLEDLRVARSDADAEVESLGEEIAKAERALAELRRDED